MEKHLVINTINLNFVKKTSSMFYTVKRHLKHEELQLVRVTPGALRATDILSPSTVKKLIVQQGTFLKRVTS